MMGRTLSNIGLKSYALPDFAPLVCAWLKTALWIKVSPVNIILTTRRAGAVVAVPGLVGVPACVDSDPPDGAPAPLEIVAPSRADQREPHDDEHADQCHHDETAPPVHIGRCGAASAAHHRQSACVVPDRMRPARSPRATNLAAIFRDASSIISLSNQIAPRLSTAVACS